MNVFKIMSVVILVMAFLFSLTFISNGLNLINYKFWAPKQENAKRQVFENTNSYIQGKTDYLNRLRFEYNKSKDPDEKAGLATLILSEASNVDVSKLPIDLQSFIQNLKDN